MNIRVNSVKSIDAHSGDSASALVEHQLIKILIHAEPHIIAMNSRVTHSGDHQHQAPSPHHSPKYYATLDAQLKNPKISSKVFNKILNDHKHDPHVDQAAYRAARKAHHSAPKLNPLREAEKKLVFQTLITNAIVYPANNALDKAYALIARIESSPSLLDKYINSVLGPKS